MSVPVAWERIQDYPFSDGIGIRSSSGGAAQAMSALADGSRLNDAPIDETPQQHRAVRAAFLTPTLLMGGAERWMLSLARRCDRRRLVWTGTALSPGAPAKPEICREMAAYMPIFAGPGAGPPGDAAYIIRCASAGDAVRRATENADVLVTWGLSGLRPLLAGIDVPVVFVSHGAGEWTNRAVHSSEPACTHFAAVSEAALLPFRPQTRAKAAVLHNGIDIERCAATQPRETTRRNLGFTNQDVLIGYVGRFSFEKNPLAAAVAARQLGGRHFAVYCGEGWQEAHVRAGAMRIAGERVRFIPHQRIVGDILAALDVFVLASPSEGFSMALAEAWFAGVPTVATRVGAVPELERRYGELVAAVPINPSPQALATAVLRATSPDFRREIVPRAQRVVAENFTAAAMARRWTEYLETIRRRRT